MVSLHLKETPVRTKYFSKWCFFCFVFFLVTTENCRWRAVTAGVFFAKSPAALLKLLQCLSGVCETGTSSLSWSQEVVLVFFMVKCCLMFTDMGESVTENKSGFLPASMTRLPVHEMATNRKTSAVFTWCRMVTLDNNHHYRWVNWWKQTAIIFDIDGIKMKWLHFIIITVRKWWMYSKYT